jgi:excisionase family DNA binding protein
LASGCLAASFAFVTSIFSMNFGRPSVTDRLTLTVEEAAEALGIGRSAAYAAVIRGEIPCIKLGRRRLIPRAKLEVMLGLSPEDDTRGPDG